MRNSLAILAFLLWTCMAHASIDQPLADAVHEQRARAIFSELRCVVCEGQSIADSNATLATQMRMHVRELVSKGGDKESILDEFRAAYGDQILLTPPVETYTLLLWLAPLLLLVVGFGVVWRVTHPRRGNAT